MSGLDFVIIGVQKGGTSALSAFLAEHPDVCMAKGKEAHVFDDPGFQDDWIPQEVDRRYAEVLDYSKPGQLRLIMILRDPVDRAISHYQMTRSRGQERLPLWLALLLEPLRLLRKDVSRRGALRVHSYCDRGHYARQIMTYRQFFRDEQLLLIDNAELKHRHDQTLTQVADFLGLCRAPTVSPRSVFCGSYRRGGHCLERLILRWYFRRSNRRLRVLLEAMGYRADWVWLQN